MNQPDDTCHALTFPTGRLSCIKIAAGPHQAPRRPGSLTVPRPSLRQKHSSPGCQAVYFWGRSLHEVQDVTVPAAVRVTQNSQEGFRQSPGSLPMHHSRVDQTQARVDCTTCEHAVFTKAKILSTGIESCICCERRVATSLTVCVGPSTVLVRQCASP